MRDQPLLQQGSRASFAGEEAQLQALRAIFGAPFVRTRRFWIDLFWALAMALSLGGVALGFFNAFEWSAKQLWDDDAYEALLASVNKTGRDGGWGPSSPNFRYVGLGACAGLAVGLVKLAWTLARVEPFPKNPPSLVTEVSDLHCHDPATSMPVMLCSAIGLACGTSVGPEAALGAVGASLGSFIGDRTGTERAGLYASLGMAAAFGPLLPSPFIAVIMLHELGFAALQRSSKSAMDCTFMEFVVLAGFASSSSYALFVATEDLTFLNATEVPPIILAARGEWTQYLGVALALGVVCGLVGLTGILLLGVGKKAGDAVYKLLRHRIHRNVAMVVTPIVGGCLYGLIAVYFPMTLGDGNTQLQSVIGNAVKAQLYEQHGIGTGADLSAGYMAVLGLFKCLALGVCLGFGFIGGQIFPLVFAGACLGSAVTQLTGLHFLVSVPCCLVAVPCAFTPIVFSFVGLTGVMLGMDGRTLSPVFVACITSYATVNGLGIVHKVLDRQVAQLRAGPPVYDEDNEYDDEVPDSDRP